MRSNEIDYRRVSSFFATDSSWNLNLLNSAFALHEVIEIKAISLPLPRKFESQFWIFEDVGVFSIKSSYDVDSSLMHISFLQKVLPKVKIFFVEIVL